MTGGKHYAEFDVIDGGEIYLGVIRPIHCWPRRKMKHDEFRTFCREQNDPAYEGDTHRYYDANNVFFKGGDIIGMLLDLEEGSLAFYKNGVRHKTSHGGLAGHYCWCVTTQNVSKINKPSVRI